MSFGTAPLEGKDLLSLKTLGTLGEPINVEVWNWYNENIDKNKCSVIDTLNVKAYPNPTSNYFQLNTKGISREKVQISVLDFSGKRVYFTEGLANGTYRFGKGFKSGAYFLQVTQGKEKQVVKLVKFN